MNDFKTPLLSIVIPTKNRYSTLLRVVDYLLSLDSLDFEIVISDNSTEDEGSRRLLEKIEDDRLKYYYVSEILSQTGNSEFVVSKAQGEYICFIGDDDGVMPNIIEVTKWMKIKGFKALKCYKPEYYWPGQKSNYLDGSTSGVLNYRKWKSNSFEVISTNKGLKTTLSKGGINIHLLPCLYHGIVERRVLDIIFDKTGTFFPGPSPDMANAVALSQVIDSYVYVNYPVCISGKSTKSIGGAGVLHKHISRIEDVSHLPYDTADMWDSRVPKYWTAPTIWAESVLKALESFGNKEAIKDFNFNYLYAWLAVFNKRDFQTIFKGFELNRSVRYYLYIIDIFILRFKVFILNRMGRNIKVKGVKDISAAVNILTSVKG